MKTEVRIAVLIPAGPRDDVFDTVASVAQYSDPSRVIVIIDDCGLLASGRAEQLRALSSGIHVIPPVEAPPGMYGGLWVKLCDGYRWILDRYDPGLILRMDADALLIGPGLEDEAELAFAADPAIGQLGACRVGPDDQPRDFSWAGRRIRRASGLAGMWRPRQWSMMRTCYRLARANGYTDGEHALGGANIYRGQAMRAIADRGWLDDAHVLGRVTICEDHLTSMMTMAAGYRIGDFSGSADPMAVTWRGLPAHPADLLARGKLITHSVRSWADLGEAEIRAVFAAARSAAAGTSSR